MSATHHAFTTFAHSEVLEVCVALTSARMTRPCARAHHVSLRTTRSGNAFSNYYTVNNPDFDIDALLERHHEENSEHDEDELVGADIPDGDPGDNPPASNTSSPLSSAPPSPSPSRAPSPSPPAGKRAREPSPPSDHIDPQAIDAALAGTARKSSKKKNSRKSRQRKAQRRDAEGNWAPPPAGLRRKARHLVDATFEQVSLDWDEQPATKTGFTAKREEGEQKLYGLDDFIGPKATVKGFKLVDWDGKTTAGLVTPDGRVFGVLAGHPDDPKWGEVHEALADEIAKQGERVKFPKESCDHRRGQFGAEAYGASHGGGQTAPGILKHKQRMTSVLCYLVGLSAMIRIAHFASSVFFNWAPSLWLFYAEHMRTLFENDPDLRQNFARSVWACITINFGPRTICFKHRDFGNLSFGWCAITALGRFDPDRGGHLVLWECGLVIRFPPGSTILIPSAILNHSNTVIGRHETRYSVTQYTAGAIFRWVQHGCRLDADYYASLSAEGLRKAREANSRRWREGVKRWSKMDDLQSAARGVVDTLGTHKDK
ncbi:hypothetical protein EV121DRAFT_218143 [Schizophyllum commune]